MTKKIFIDCGTHMFQGFYEFVNKFKIDNSWECYSFEANPITFEKSKPILNSIIKNGFNISHKNIAISNQDGYIKINCEVSEDGTGQGSNILYNPPSLDKQWGHNLNYIDNEILVESIDFVKFIKEKCSENDYVLIKMDIEGSEFMVLDSIIQSDVIKIIGDIYVEFHERFFEEQDVYKHKKEKYMQEFLKNGVILNEWI